MIKNEKGSVTLIVVATVLFILIVLSASLMFVSTKRKAQLQESQILQNVYGGDLYDTYQGQAEKYLSALDITANLYGQYVDLGLDVDGNRDTTNDWEIFYAGNGRIYLISADYVPASALESWKVIGSGTKLGDAGFQQYSNNYNMYWPSEPTQFFDLPDLNLVMHNGYNLSEHNNNANSIAVSQLLNKEAWKGIKEAVSKDNQNCIDFVIGGPTIEMWCAAWSEVVKDDTNGFVPIEAKGTNDVGYYASASTKKNQTWLSMNGTNGTDNPLGDKLTKLGERYKSFYPHITFYNDCHGYWLASPSSSRL